MTFYRGGARRRRDAIEPDIIAALRARGAQGRPTVLEVKSGATARLSAVQARAQAPWPVVRSVAEAVAAVEAV